jgi:Tfp pilus assembly protein PilO
VKNNLGRATWWITVSLAGLTAAYIFFLFLPGWKSVEACRRETADKKNYIGQGSGLPTALQASQQELQKTQAYNAHWSNKVPRYAQKDPVFKEINAQAKLSGATTALFSPEPRDKHDQLSRLPLEMRLNGTSGQIYDFLRRLDQLPAPIWVDRVRMVGKDGEAMGAEISMAVFVDNSDNSDYIKSADRPIK